MFALVQTELDFDVIEDELEQRIGLLGQELFVAHANEALLELEERHNISTPLAERVSGSPNAPTGNSKCRRPSPSRSRGRSWKPPSTPLPRT